MWSALLVCSLVFGGAHQLDSPSISDVGCYETKDKGKSYRGLVTKAESGRTCQNWLINKPHEIKSTITPMPDNGISNHNYCRNPDGSAEKPWCYTLDPSPDHMKETCTVPVCPEQSRDFLWDAKFLASKMGEVHVGSFSVGREGVEVKPQFKFGFKSDHLKAEGGLGDVRDGLRISAKAEAFIEADAEGHNVHELHRSIHLNEDGFNDALQTAKKILEGHAAAAKDVIKQIAEAVGSNPVSIEHVLAGEENPRGDMAKLRVIMSVQVGASAEVRMGWCDTDGYHMVGVGGSAATGLSMRASAFAGKHKSGTSMKIILMLANFAFEYTLPTEE